MECSNCHSSHTRSVGKSIRVDAPSTLVETNEYFFCEDCKTYTNVSLEKESQVVA